VSAARPRLHTPTSQSGVALRSTFRPAFFGPVYAPAYVSVYVPACTLRLTLCGAVVYVPVRLLPSSLRSTFQSGCYRPAYVPTLVAVHDRALALHLSSWPGELLVLALTFQSTACLAPLFRCRAPRMRRLYSHLVLCVLYTASGPSRPEAVSVLSLPLSLECAPRAVLPHGRRLDCLGRSAALPLRQCHALCCSRLCVQPKRL